MGGGDRSKVLLCARSFEEYLEKHFDKLKANWYYSKRGTIEFFPADPRTNRGSVTITNGVRIEAVGHNF